MPTAELLVDRMTVGPVLPATILVGLLVLYTLVAMIGLIDFDLGMPDLDIDVPDPDIPDLNVDAHHVDLDLLQGIGGSALRFINLGRVPMIIWGGFFTVAFWSIAYTLWHHFDVTHYQPDFLTSSILTARNVILSVLVTKICTGPLIKYFAPLPRYDTKRIVGSTCEVVSLEATAQYGQAKFRTHAAPLLLNIRAIDGQTFQKGDEVRIVACDESKRIYQVTSLDPENFA